MSDSDTIVALATPPGRGGVAIVRVSGDLAPGIAAAICGRLPRARHAVLRRFCDCDGDAIDFGIVLRFRAPHSFTGEHVVEFQGHGGPVVCAALIARCVELGARRAEPGEFSRRAFLNDRLDLTQAEAIADIIDSGSRQAARAALRSLEGAFSAAVTKLMDMLTQLRMHVEAAIDFPDEEIDFLTDPALVARIDALEAEFRTLSQRAREGRLLNDGFQVVLVGEPNAGKSSLMNRLAAAEAAIVTAVPGTTRDLVRAKVDLDGLPVEFIDTAGLREAPDEVEFEGIRRARQAIAGADHALLIVDATTLGGAGSGRRYWEKLDSELPDELARTRILNKIDLTGQAAGPLQSDCGVPTLAVSALTEDGLGALRLEIRHAAGHDNFGEGSFSARERHLDALREAHRHFVAGREALASYRAGELLAEELRLAHTALGRITGEVTSDELLGRIFSRFCIGK